MRKKVHSLRASDETWQRLEKKAERLGFDSIGKMLDAESQLENLKTKMAYRRRTIHEYAVRNTINDLIKKTAEKRNLTLKEAGDYIIQENNPATIRDLVLKSAEIELRELRWHGVPTLSEAEEVNFCPFCDDEPVFATKAALKKHIKEQHPEKYQAVYGSGRRVGGT